MIPSSVSALAFPAIDPVLLQLGPLAVRWYSLAYVAGVVLGWWYVARLNAALPAERRAFSKAALDDLMIWAIGGIVLGGRAGYVLFYKPDYFLAHPEDILKLWQGGMSFHGGLLGVLAAFWLFCRRYSLRFFAVTDLLACATPIGLGLGRIANFINGELFGRVTDAPWAMVFPGGGPLPRHPSQLYEAALEGGALFILLNLLFWLTPARTRTGFLSGAFLAGYSLSRMLMEQFREPDDYLGFLFGQVTMGQILSFPMLVFGLFLMLRALLKPAQATA